MEFTLNRRKTVQAAAVLLKTQMGRQMTYLRLLKLLYLAERHILKESGVMITGDTVVSMKDGPVLSHTYNMIKGDDVKAKLWERFFVVSGYQVRMRDDVDPGNGYLSAFEIQTLHEITKEHEGRSDYELVDWIHKNCPEWTDPREKGKKMIPLPLRNVLLAIGKSESEIDTIFSEAQYHSKVSAIMSHAEKSVK